MQLGLKVDVDTLSGMTEGVPALLHILAARGIRASFFAALGPDNSGRAVFRVFRQQGFLEKMLRSRAPSIYGWRTMLYGTLLPAPRISEAAADVLPRVGVAGHELGLHGFDHVRWHDRLLTMSREEVDQEIQPAQSAFYDIMGTPAASFAAPGWQATRNSREALAAAGMLYASDTRGSQPFFPRFGPWTSPLLEIPTTLPTLDELLGLNGCTADDFFALILSRLENGSPQVLTLHAELEGGPFKDALAGFLDRCLARGVAFFCLADWAQKLLERPQDIPAAPVFQGRVPGRAGTVSRQGWPEGRS
ncbi:MAG: polysaccharide deacetylase family protein [Thermodesulfobacteriota bacterium]